MELVAVYKIQYLLKVVSDLGDPQGEGWYDAGSEATVSVDSPQPDTGLLGSLGARKVFEEWSGDLTSDSGTTIIKMDGPKTVEAKWTTDNSQPYMILGGIGVVVVVVIILAFLLMRRKRAPASTYGVPSPAYAAPSPPPPPARARPPFCESCGSPTTYIKQYQRYYCYKCKKYA
jgi:hypothetical protein